MDFLECKICHIHYDEEEHRPRNAPCGHEFCTVCISALIKDSLFVCPKCRQKNRINVANDMPVNFGLIDVIRAFKSKSINSAKETDPKVSGATNDEVCIVHCKELTHWCYKCQFSICKECLESHITIAGCSTTTAQKAIEDMKEKHLKNVDMALKTFQQDTKYLSFRIQQLHDEKQDHLEKAEKCDEEVKNIFNSIEQGKNLKERLLESNKLLNEPTSPLTFSEKIKVANQRKQILHAWSVKNVERDTPAGLLKTLEEEKGVYTEIVVNGEKKRAKLSRHQGSVHLNPFLKQAVPDGCIMPFDRIKKMIPETPLVFVELSLFGAVKGKAYIRLDKQLPNIRDHVLHIVTGQQGPTLIGVKFDNYSRNYMRTIPLPSCVMKLTLDSNKISIGKSGEVLGHFADGYLQFIFFCFGTKDFGSSCPVLGYIEKGINIVQECHDRYRSLMISNCGLVIEQE
ncbi:unnamed protein product [Meganyctiphanes norvegica]|uniref:RING-type domain-containing protein n=1 Tax=Meganyctiphanes norvegica TaxID=48144 RepID=A0AAV2RUE9_MEGNR